MKFIIKKIVTFTITLFFISIIAFLMFQVIPGDSVIGRLGMNATPERIEALRAEYGLDGNIVQRYIDWLVGFVTGDGGKSYTYNIPVVSLMRPNITVTIILAVYSMIMILAFGIPAGLVMGSFAYGRNKKISYGIGKFLDIAGQGVMAIPSFFLGIIISITFGLALNWFIPGKYVSYDENFIEFLGCITPAAVAIAVPKTAMLSKYVKNAVIKTMGQDYIRTARSKGMGKMRIMMKHVMRNSMISVTTVAGVIAAEIFAGSIVVEQVFNIPGLGKVLINSLNGRDYPVVLGSVMYITIVVLLINLIVDIIYMLLDPRINRE